MYHSVSADGPGPVSITPEVFKDQLAVLADAGGRGVSVSDYVNARRSNLMLPPGTVVLTFDDGYRDFAEVVRPSLPEGWRCTVFLPVEPIDHGRPWDCGDGHPRPLLTWRTIRELADTGIEFGAHSMTHSDLTRLTPGSARDEVALSGARIRERTGHPVEGFAPPFGRITPALRNEVSKRYAWCVGTTMSRAGPTSNLFDLPRLEMWYFRDVRRWRRYVQRGWTPYFALRKAMRAVRESL
jgi:peptidoglycan/xylan/chitin deacetylase (PgdA/CDA1 family)